MKVKERAAKYKSPPKIYTYDDCLELPDDGNRYEIINGELIMVPAPYTDHQTISYNLVLELGKFLERTQTGRIFYAPCDVILSETNVVQPDILFISNERSAIITEKNISAAPDLVIEIISPSSAYYDLIEKKELYEKYGVKEYWLVDPKKHWIEVHVNTDSKFQLHQRCDKEGTIHSVVLADFDLDLTNIFPVK